MAVEDVIADSAFIDLEPYGPGRFSNPIAINNEEFIVCSHRQKLSKYGNNRWKGVVVFNTKTNKWTDYISYPMNLVTTYHSIAIHKKKRLMYLYNSEHILVIIDLNKKEFVYTSPVNLEYDGSYCSTMVINDRLHVFGGWNHAKHIIFNDMNHTFEENYTLNDFNEGFISHEVIHIPSKHLLFIMGGRYGSSGERLNDIYCYEYEKNKWSVLPLKLPKKMKSFGSVLTTDEKMIILFGGEEQNDIFILKINTMEFVTCKLKCPFEGPCYAVIMNNKIKGQQIVFGFVKKCFRDIEWENIPYPPDDILKMLCHWYSVDYIHLIKRNRNIDFHYKIALSDVLRNL